MQYSEYRRGKRYLHKQQGMLRGSHRRSQVACNGCTFTLRAVKTFFQA